MSKIKSTVEIFADRFGEPPAVLARAPGRVNLIGEHTDYNEGFVLPFAIDRGIEIAASPARGDRTTLYSTVFDESVSFAHRLGERYAERHWQNYARGIVATLRGMGIEVPPANLAIGGDLPTGGGLSSSAALCIALAKALLSLSEREVDGLTIARAAQTAEREFAGTPCGIMDQYVSVFGKAEHALLIDCRALTHRYVPVCLAGFEFLILPSGVKHELSEGGYERRVTECVEAVQGLRRIDPTIRALRDVTASSLADAGNALSPVAAKRARHVVSENERVHRAVSALKDIRIEDLGRLLLASHDSLRDDYEVSCAEIEQIMAVLRSDRRVIGARMVGGGFGGSILAITREGALADLRGILGELDHPRCPAVIDIISVKPSAGVWCRVL